MGIEKNKVMVNVGIPYGKLLWIDSVRGNTSRSEYLGRIILPVVEKRIKLQQEEQSACNQL